MNVALFGATGFSGQAVLHELLEKGHQVTALVRNASKLKTAHPNSFISDATKATVEVMEQKGVRRLIAMSNVGAGDSMNFYPWYFRKLILPYFMKWLQLIIDDKNKMEPFLQKSQLDWTVVRCPNIIDKPAKGKTHATLTGEGLKLSIKKADMASFLVRQLTDNQYMHQLPSISN